MSFLNAIVIQKPNPFPHCLSCLNSHRKPVVFCVLLNADSATVQPHDNTHWTFVTETRVSWRDKSLMNKQAGPFWMTLPTQFTFYVIDLFCYCFHSSPSTMSVRIVLLMNIGLRPNTTKYEPVKFYAIVFLNPDTAFFNGNVSQTTINSWLLVKSEHVWSENSIGLWRCITPASACNFAVVRHILSRYLVISLRIFETSIGLMLHVHHTDFV